MKKLKSLLVEKYRPTTMEEYVFPDEETQQLAQGWVDSGQIPNLMLSGSAGVGKTTLVRVLINELGIQPSDVKQFNASEKGIDYVRDVIQPWTMKTSFSGFKVVVMEEADALSPQAQKALRAITEENTDSVRWVITCNYPKNVIPPLHSRFQHIHIDSMNEDNVINMIVDIMEKEGLDVEEGDHFFTHINAYKPDIRKILNSIDQHTHEGFIAPLRGISESSDIDEWETLWSSEGELDLDKALAIADYADGNNFDNLYRVMYENHHKFSDVGSAMVHLSTYLDRAQTSANQPLHLKAFLYHVFLVEGGDDE